MSTNKHEWLINMQAPLELEQFISSHPKACDPNFRSSNMRKPNSKSFFIYSLDTLNELLKEMRANKEIPELRYLVDASGRLWFARETHAGGPSAPAHYQMTGEASNSAYCKTAGNIKFDENYQIVSVINHKSGDFRPSFVSLQWLFAILLKKHDLPFILPEKLTIEELNSNNIPITAHEWPIEILNHWAQKIEDPLILKIISNQPKETKTVTYSPPESTETFVRQRFHASARRVISFSDADDTHTDTDSSEPAAIRRQSRPLF